MAARRARSPARASAAIAGHIAAVLGAAAAEQARATPRRRPALAWLRRLVAASAWLAHALERWWVAYPALAMLQLKVLWGDWDYRDLTPGDTADYFIYAYGWATHLTVEIVRSPLYTAFYGSLLHLSTAGTRLGLHAHQPALRHVTQASHGASHGRHFRPIQPVSPWL